MATYQIEVECTAVAQLTGRLGIALVNFRGHDYRVDLGGREIITRDGYPCGIDALPGPVWAFATKQYADLLVAHRNRQQRENYLKDLVQWHMNSA